MGVYIETDLTMMENGIYWDYLGIMVQKMETTIAISCGSG